MDWRNFQRHPGPPISPAAPPRARHPGRFPPPRRAERGGSFPDRPASPTMIFMSEQPHPILIGCSGWSYPDWEGAFFPVGMEAGEYLGYYADRFPIVEVASTFYRV